MFSFLSLEGQFDQVRYWPKLKAQSSFAVELLVLIQWMEEGLELPGLERVEFHSRKSLPHSALNRKGTEGSQLCLFLQGNEKLIVESQEHSCLFQLRVVASDEGHRVCVVCLHPYLILEGFRSICFEFLCLFTLLLQWVSG